MKDLTNKEYEKDIDLDEAMKELIEKRDEILSSFAKAFLAESGLSPSDVELVHKSYTENNEIINTFYFRERKDGPQG
jgi:hypothetical protein